MNKTTAVKQVITLALWSFVFYVSRWPTNSLKSVPGLEARVGEAFTVTLDSSADPAFRWDLLATDQTKVQLIDYPDAKEAVANTEVWTFRALAPGKVTLYFGYLRIGSPNTPAIRTHSVQLTVDP